MSPWPVSTRSPSCARRGRPCSPSTPAAPCCSIGRGCWSRPTRRASPSRGILRKIEMDKIRIAVVGAGQFGHNHCRVVGQSEAAILSAVVDIDAARAAEAAAPYGCEVLTDYRQLAGNADAVIVAVPTSAHADAGCFLMESGMDVLVEKPIAPDVASADRLLATASATGRILQVGHLERFNPAVAALEERVALPLFFEI